MKRAFRQARKSGVLSIPAKGLKQFPEEICHLMDFLEADEKGWECVDLVRIDISHNEIPTIPAEIGGLVGLLSFKMCQNQLTSVPDELMSLNTLSYLDLSSNYLSGDFPASLGQLRNLKELALGNNKLASLPESLGQLTLLEVLSIECNNLSTLPESIGSLTKLQKLTAQSNQLESIPLTFSNLQAIATLDLSKNKLSSLQGCLKHNKSLTYLDLRQNRLTVFPQLPLECSLDSLLLGFNQLTSINEDSLIRAQNCLTVLDLRENKLSVLSDNICLLHRLKTLDLTNNDLSDLPPGLGYLNHLNHILIDGNSMRSIRRAIISAGCEPLKKYLRTRGKPPAGVDAMDEEIDEFTELDGENTSELTFVLRDAGASGTLELTDKRYQAIPSEVLAKTSLLEKLILLNLSKNGLTTLPAELSQCVNLQTLVVEENALESLPDCLSSLSQLQLLRLRKNNLTEAAFVGIFRPATPLSMSLKELDLRNNALQAIPSGIDTLVMVHTLLLSYNRISTLETIDWTRLNRLSILSIADNKLTSIGNVFEVQSLASLSLENNSLTQIPCELGLCPNLKALYINGNPQRTVRIATINKGTDEIKLYLKNKLTPEEVEAIRQQQQARREKAVEPPSVKKHHALPTQPATKPPPSSRLPTPPKATSATIASPAPIARAAPVAAPAPVAEAPREGKMSIAMYQIEETIARLESQLENDSALSAAKRFALKKELAKARAEKIRESRKLN